jgi:hypothetical protein
MGPPEEEIETRECSKIGREEKREEVQEWKSKRV